MTQQLVVPLSAESSDERETTSLLDVLHREGFDLRRRMFVAFVIDFAGRREDAFAASQSLRTTDWDTSLYGDNAGWVLRVSRVHRLTHEALMDLVSEARGLAARCHGQVRAVTVEDLRQDDVWAEMAAQLQGGSRRRSDEESAAGALPAPRQGRAARADR